MRLFAAIPSTLSACPPPGRHRTAAAVITRTSRLAAAALLTLCLCATVANAANVHFHYINPVGGTPNTNSFRIQACATNILADGTPAQLLGLPVRLYPDTNGEVIATNLQINWYADLDHKIVFQVYDSSTTLYDVTNLWQSGFNLFVVRNYGTGATNLPTFNQLTNLLGGKPLVDTNLPGLTNGAITLLQATNVSAAQAQSVTNGFIGKPDGTNIFNALIVAPTNTLGTAARSNASAFLTPPQGTNIFNGLIVGGTNGLIAKVDSTNIFNALIVAPTNTLGTAARSNTSAFLTPPQGTNLFNGLIVGGTNGLIAKVDSTNIFNALIVAPTNTLGTAARSNTSAFLTPPQGTNIFNGLIVTATNGHIAKLDSTNIFNALIVAPTNSLGTAARSNATAFYPMGANPSNYVNLQTATNIASGTAQAQTNGFITKLDSTNIFNGLIVSPTNFLATVKLNKTNDTAVSLTLINPFTDVLTVTNTVTHNTVAVRVQNGSGDLQFQRGTSSGTDATIGSNSITTGVLSANSIVSAPILITSNTAFGTLTNLTRNTNFLAFIKADASALTNAVFQWQSAQGKYSNSWTGCTITNTGSAWFARDASGSSLCAITNASPVGFWSDIGGGTAVADFGLIAIENGTFHGGIITATNLVNNGTNSPAAGQILSFAGGGKTKWIDPSTVTTNGFIGFNDGTNIFNALIVGGTNGLIAKVDSTNIFNALIVSPTNSLGTAARSNATAFYPMGANPSNYVNLVTGTNLFNGLIAAPSNTLATANATASNTLATATATASNTLATVNATASNFLATVEMPATNGFAKNPTLTNLSIQGDIAFGPAGTATNILSRTNVLKFINAGSSITTNGANEWLASIGGYTNRATGLFITNNTSAWLAQTNGVTLYAVTNAIPVGNWIAINGDLPAPTSLFGFYFDHNGVVDVGPILGNGGGITNIVHSSTVTASNGVSVALSQNADGSTNYQVVGGVTNTTVFQYYTNINHEFIAVTNAAGVTSVDGTNGIYLFAGLFGSGVLYYTNSSVASGQVIILSNGPASQLQLTNTVAHLLLYHKAAVANGFINVNAWTADSGGSPGPNARFTNIVTYATNGHGVLIQPHIITPDMDTNLIELSLSGNDTNGIPGASPFRTLEYALRFTTNNPTYIFLHPGVYTNYNTVPTNLNPPFTSIVGSGRGVSFLLDPMTVGNTMVAVLAYHTNVFANLTIAGKIHNAGNGNNITNLTLIDCDVGTTNGIDCFFTTGGAGTGFYGLQAWNCAFYSSWDITFGVNDGVWNNCKFVATWWSTNSSDQSAFSGTHCMMMGILSDQTIPFHNVVNGGTMTIAGGIPSTSSGSSNACIWMTGTNCHLVLNGPTLTHSASNNVPHFALYNTTPSLDVHGWYYDVGTFGTNVPAMTIVSGTNFYYSGVVTTTTPTIAQLQNAPGSVSWNSNGVSFITSSTDGSSVTTTKLAP